MSDEANISVAQAIADLQAIAVGHDVPLDPEQTAEFAAYTEAIGEVLAGLDKIAKGESEGFRVLKDNEAAFRKRFDAILKDLPELSEEDEAKLPPAPDYVQISK